MHLIQLGLNITKAVRHLQPFMNARTLEDDSLAIKTVLTEALSGPLVRPWAVHSRRGPALTIVGYGEMNADEINARRALALPSLQAAVGEALSIEMPPLREGTTYRFSVRLVPTVRVTPTGDKRHGERDAFLVAADKAGRDACLSRDDVYADYLKARLGGADIETCRLDSFRLARLVRPTKDGQSSKTMPEAILSGRLCVTSSDELLRELGSGIGRQRAYGYGMVRLQPQHTSR